MQHFPQAREKNARETYFDAIGRSRRAITVIILRRHSFNVSQSGCIEVDEGRLVVIFFLASFSIASLLVSLSFCLVGLLLSSSGCVLVRSVNAVQHYSRLFGESLFNAFSRSFPASNCKTARINNQGFFEFSYPRLFDLIVPASYRCSSAFPSSLLQFSVFSWKIIHCSPSREIHFSVSCNRLEGNAAEGSRDSYIETASRRRGSCCCIPRWRLSSPLCSVHCFSNKSRFSVARTYARLRLRRASQIL